MGYYIYRSEVARVGRAKFGDISLTKGTAGGGDAVSFQEIVFTVMSLESLGLSKGHFGRIICDGSVTPAEISALNGALLRNGFATLTAAGGMQASNPLGAHAFAQGNHIGFGPTGPGLQTIAHEAAHVVQQNR